MSFTNRIDRSESVAASRRRFWRAARVAWITVAALALSGPSGVALAQNFFPPTPPAQVFSEDFSGGLDWGVWQRMPTGSGTWTDADRNERCSGWGTHLKSNIKNDPRVLLVASPTMPGNGGYDPNNYTNIRIEYDFKARPAEEGLGWGFQPDSNGDGYPDAGYLVYFDNFGNRNDPAGPGNRAQWHLIRRENDVNTEIGTAQVVLRAGVKKHDSMYVAQCYHVRIEWFCGNLRVQAREYWASTWHTMVEWTEPGTILTPGGVGFYHNVPGSKQQTGFWDNLVVSSWGPDCAVFCDPWTTWNTTWPGDDESAIDTIPFKLLFDAVLADDTLIAQDGTFRGGDPLCGPWHLLADLPDPTQPAGSNTGEIQSYLERVSTSKSASDMFTFSDNFDATNPIPLMYWGQTPIKETLQSAYQWYEAIRGPGGRWSDAADPLSSCRNWYIIFITDGEESCLNPGEEDVCGWLSSGPSFANPANGLDPVPILTIGFSANVDVNSPLKCMSSLTGGSFHTASTAGELAAAIADVVNTLTEKERSFLPVTVSPEPTTLGSSFSNEFLLTIPIFKPKNDHSVWEGHYYGFRINPLNPLPPMDADGKLDTSMAEWDAQAQISAQIASNNRKIFYSRDSGGKWKSRTVFPNIKNDGTLLAEFKAWTGEPLDAKATEMVDFVTGESSNRSFALGDIFHSKPAIIGPPNNFAYYLNNVHDYFTDFMSSQHHRRRVAFVGSNDGLFHGFDAGFYDRDETNWNDTFDLGNGVELFGYVPHAVLDPPTKPSVLKTMTFGKEQVYSVDGPVTSADVYIDPTGGNNREWRTVVLFGLRKGGRGVTALDVTQPDPINPMSGEPQLSALPGCINGGSGCSGEYPSPLWEFTADDDTDADADGQKDLGLTWSQPVIARVKVQGGGDAFVTFFGGGMPVRPADPADLTGRSLYGLNVATGTIVYKEDLGTPVPGGLAVLDQDDDGFADRVYFGDTAGGLWRLDVTNPVVDAGGGNLDTSSWTLTKIYEFDNLDATDSDGNPITVPANFFMTPKLVPVAFNGGTYTWGIAIGSGNRAQVGKMDGVENRFYFVMDVDDTTRDETDLTGVSYDSDPDPNPDSTYFDPSGGTYGWYLRLRPNEKVTTDGIVVQEKVHFATFEATPPGADEGKCSAGGLARIYQVYYNNVNPVNEHRGEETEGGLVGGGTSFTVGDTTVSWWTHMDTGGTAITMGQHRFHRVTNWRQK